MNECQIFDIIVRYHSANRSVNMPRMQRKTKKSLKPDTTLQISIYESLRVTSSLPSCLQMDEWHALG